MAENLKLILTLLVILGFGLRVTQLGAIGFAEDEMNKLDAIHAYERGDFSVNSEHPMVMKLLMWASVNKVPGDSVEAALRLPNALIGALTVIPIFLLTLAFFDRWTALLAAAFWTVGINAMLFLAIKVPIVTLAAFLVGLFVAIRRPRQVGHAFLLFMFLFWIVPYSLIGGKWLRYTLSVMPFVYMIAAVGVVALVRWATARFSHSRRTGFVLAAIAVVVFVCFPAWTAFANRPHYALYTNAFAADKAGYFFPHDEFYDDGLREAIKFVSENAPQGATIAHETPGVVRHYISDFGRTDLNSQVISSSQFDVTSATGPVFVIFQTGRTYFENRDELAVVRAKFRRVHTVTIEGVTAAEVFVNQ